MNSSTGSRKHLESIGDEKFTCLMYKLLTILKNKVDLSSGFDWDRRWKQHGSTAESTKAKTEKFLLWFYQNYLPELQNVGNCCIWDKMEFDREKKRDNAVSKRAAANQAAGKVTIVDLGWYLLH